MSERKKLAEQIVDALEADINNRSGMDLAQFDDEVRAEIREAWLALVVEQLGKCPECKRAKLGQPKCDICDNPATWWHPDDCFSYCDEHCPEGDKIWYLRDWSDTWEKLK